MSYTKKWLVALGALAGMGCREPDETAQLLEALAQAAPSAASAAATASSAAPAAINPRLLRRFEPLRSEFDTADNELTSFRINLGRQLYFDKRLSRRQNVSCNSCHVLSRFGVDREATSKGTAGERGTRNSPTVYNAAGLFAQFWDGREASVETQALAPILNPIEMGLPSAADATRLLESMPDYVAAFRAAFPREPKPLTWINVGRAIGAFERKLTTPARWDAYLRGRQDALNAAELEGLAVFTNVGCMVCHTGELIGGSMFQKVGLVTPWPNQQDQGRFEVTKRDVDRMMFRVPSLRNVAETAPYFHDGSAATLELAVERMAFHQLGLNLAKAEVNAIVSWLRSLTGTLPAQYIAEPSLPASGEQTPGPIP